MVFKTLSQLNLLRQDVQGTNLTVLEARHDQVKRITPDIDRGKYGLCYCVLVIWEHGEFKLHCDTSLRSLSWRVA